MLDLAGPLGRPATAPGERPRRARRRRLRRRRDLSARARAAGPRRRVVTSIVGARTAELVILARPARARERRSTYVCTDDGSLGYHGLSRRAARRAARRQGAAYTDLLRGRPDGDDARGRRGDAAARLLTFVSLDPIMLDGTGMCGAVPDHRRRRDEVRVRRRPVLRRARGRLRRGRRALEDVRRRGAGRAARSSGGGGVADADRLPDQDRRCRSSTRSSARSTLGRGRRRLHGRSARSPRRSRCVQCQDPLCEQGCPVGVPIRDFIRRVAVGGLRRRLRLIRTRNVAPRDLRPRLPGRAPVRARLRDRSSAVRAGRRSAGSSASSPTGSASTPRDGAPATAARRAESDRDRRLRPCRPHRRERPRAARLRA